MDSSSNPLLLESMLQVAVPLWLIRLEGQGGPMERDWKWAQEYADDLAHHGDNLLFNSKKKGETAALFNGLARVIAIMAYVPGGVTIFGRHWEVSVDTESAE